MQRKTAELIESMEPWREFGNSPSIQTRTPEQCAWDSAIQTAAELMRRIDNYDEHRASIILQSSIPCERNDPPVPMPEFVDPPDSFIE